MAGITAVIAGRDVPREDVLAWERRRAAKVLAKLGSAFRSGDVAALRRAHVERKLELGHERIERLIRRELHVSALAGRAGATLSRERRRMCTIDLVGQSTLVETIPAWYREAIAANDEAPLIEACPDHYISRSRPDGTQEVIETVSGICSATSRTASVSA